MMRFPEKNNILFIFGLWTIAIFIIVLLFKITILKKPESNKNNEESKQFYPSSLNGWAWEKTVYMDWKKILHFIPDKKNPKKNQGCLQLFTTPTSSGITNSLEPYEKYQEYMKLLEAESQRLKNLKQLPADVHEKLTFTYQTIAKEPWVKTVCELGFDQGKSALAWLTAKPDLTLHSFDIGTLQNDPPIVKIVKENFRNRFFFHRGFSDVLLPLWSDKMKEKCDIISVDGAHNYTFVFMDFFHMWKMAAQKNIVIGYDIDHWGKEKPWSIMKELLIITEKYRCHITDIDIDFVIGKFGEYFWA